MNLPFCQAQHWWDKTHPQQQEMQLWQTSSAKKLSLSRFYQFIKEYCKFTIFNLCNGLIQSNKVHLIVQSGSKIPTCSQQGCQLQTGWSTTGVFSFIATASFDSGRKKVTNAFSAPRNSDAEPGVAKTGRCTAHPPKMEARSVAYAETTCDGGCCHRRWSKCKRQWEKKPGNSWFLPNSLIWIFFPTSFATTAAATATKPEWKPGMTPSFPIVFKSMHFESPSLSPLPLKTWCSNQGI